MTDTPQDARDVDPGRDTRGNPFDHDAGEYGLDYDKDREAELGRQRPSGTVAARPGDPHPPRAPNMPPDNGMRASFDPRTGAVHGSGSGAGGGNPGEDFSSDAAAGDGYPQTGGEGSDKSGDTDLGPPHARE